jgi:hypothetical protein
MDFGESEDDVTLEQIEAFEEAVGKHQAIVASSSYGESKAFPFTTWKSSPPQRHSAHLLVALGQTLRNGARTIAFPRRHRCRKMGCLYRFIGGQAKTFGSPIFVAWGLK